MSRSCASNCPHAFVAGEGTCVPLLPSTLMFTHSVFARCCHLHCPENRPENLILPSLRRVRKTLPLHPCYDVFYHIVSFLIFYHIVSFLIPNPQHTVSLYTFIYQESAWSGRSGLVIPRTQRNRTLQQRQRKSSPCKNQLVLGSSLASNTASIRGYGPLYCQYIHS